MAIFYIIIGITHFINPDWFVQIVPPIFGYPLMLVLISGFFEILLGFFLFFEKTKKIAGWGLICLLIAVFPANIYLAMTNGDAMNTTPLIAWGRLPFQFVFIYLAYFYSQDS
tara:strand:- start:335 stop:670 length:336 start_codon:yes stop_codon:yes gene_type:complete